ncbi:low-specificity L-threonine aldolase [Geobacter sp. SVR]|uniref:low-specificity L-threonine aldolase n=1 Tax=Geobacter sp. SVR TaxID=2495594 RepID=UPI00143F0527|nr:low-specificity L-threonine aldolase [Geobacter sp. SVR]BCS52852.1 threonine aldolase [Geobacter sp. SVR]GCF86719.1 threonine aldolase [Geobacter sp. SVR]
MKVIDLRSDTVTQPTRSMRMAMAEAEVGDDVYGEDPTVNRLEAMAAELLGTEAALFVASGTQSNLLALMSHCERGDEYIVGQDAHCYRYEGGGAAVLGSIQPQPLEFEQDGTLDLARVARAIKPADHHFARTRLLCLENTVAGKVLPLDYLARAHAFALERNLAIHLDGARIFNAAVKQGVPVREISRHFDSVSVCLSKGLGAPVGSLLCGTRVLIEKAHRWRKVLGGGMRQAGLLAAAGIVALSGHVDRLADDHENARRLALGLAELKGLTVDPASVQTNMVFVGVGGRGGELSDFLKQRGIMIFGQENLRLVTHLDITSGDIDTVIAAFGEFFAGK